MPSAAPSVMFPSVLSRKHRRIMIPTLFSSAAVALNHISQKDNPKLLDVTVYADESAAKRDLAKGLISAVVVFPSEISNDHAVRLYVDSSNSIIPSLVESAVRSVLATLGAHNPVTVNKIYGDIKYITVLRRWCHHDGNFHLNHVRRWDCPDTGS